MSDFTPLNSLEIRLRAMITNNNTLSWSFYTPLAAAPLWIFVKHYPELDGSGPVAPPGTNPGVVTFRSPGDENSYIGLYTAASRAEEAFAKLKLSRATMTITSAQGFQLLRFLSPRDSWLYMNLGLPECHYCLDPDMVEILLERPEPTLAFDEPRRQVNFRPEGDPQSFLGPLRDFLGQQPNVRAAWILGQKPDAPLPARHRSYEVGLLMTDPEDKSLLEKVRVMAKALTPLEMEWTTGVLLADGDSLQKLAQENPPFYRAADFLKTRRS